MTRVHGKELGSTSLAIGVDDFHLVIEFEVFDDGDAAVGVGGCTHDVGMIGGVG